MWLDKERVFTQHQALALVLWFVLVQILQYYIALKYLTVFLLWRSIIQTIERNRNLDYFSCFFSCFFPLLNPPSF